MHKLNVATSQSKKFTSVGFGLLIRNNKGEVLAASCDRVEKKLNPLCTVAFVMRKALQFFQSTSFYKVEMECNFAEPVDLLNSNRICPPEVAWILEDITLIIDNFVFISFASIGFSQCCKRERGGHCLVRRMPFFSLPHFTI